MWLKLEGQARPLRAKGGKRYDADQGVNRQGKKGWQVDLQAFFNLSCEYGTFFI